MTKRYSSCISTCSDNTKQSQITCITKFTQKAYLFRTNGESQPVSPKQAEEKEKDQFDGVDVQTEKLSHPTANRAKPPQRRPPSQVPAAQV